MAEPTAEQIEKIVDALAAGRKIEAIKICREATGKNLKDAKNFVEALLPKLLEQDPERFAKVATKGPGCFSAVLVFGLVVSASITLATKMIWRF